MRAYWEAQRRGRHGVPCPLPWVVVMLAERFGVTPWAIEEAPSDRVLHYLHLLLLESEYRGDTAGLRQEEPLYDLGEE